jgi:hypothetical protein
MSTRRLKLMKRTRIRRKGCSRCSRALYWFLLLFNGQSNSSAAQSSSSAALLIAMAMLCRDSWRMAVTVSVRTARQAHSRPPSMRPPVQSPCRAVLRSHTQQCKPPGGAVSGEVAGEVAGAPPTIEVQPPPLNRSTSSDYGCEWGTCSISILREASCNLCVNGGVL